MKVTGSWKGHPNHDPEINHSEESEDPISPDELLFKDMTRNQKIRSVVIVIIKLLSFLGLLYIFIVSLGLLESAFQLLGGKAAGQAFNSGVLSNPLAGLMIGVLATVLVQSSSTSTSIVVTLVGSNIVPVKNAVPIIMGANIGTSVTNTIVSLAQASNRNEFRLAFSGATVHDMFNWLTVIVLLPLEIAVGYLQWLSGLLVDSMGLEAGNKKKAPDMLKAITEPVIDAIVQINKNAISDSAANSNASSGDVLKRWCKTEIQSVHKSRVNNDYVVIDCHDASLMASMKKICEEVNADSKAAVRNVTLSTEWDTYYAANETKDVERCDSLFSKTDLGDAATGAIILVCSLVLLLLALFLIVKILNSMLSGSVSRVIKKTINADFPGPFAYFTGYVFLLVGCGMTMIVQSSSVFTSTLTPLVGIGIVSVDRMYPMTLGSNIGTTITAILAALSQSGEKLRLALQIALCHLFFNISGIVIFYPIPFMRWPITLAKALGKTTSKHRWFAIFYIILMFILLPAFIFALSLAGWVYLGAIGGPLLLFFFIVAIINILQKKKPAFLPVKLRNWEFLPLCCHSLKPVDRLIERVFTCKYCQTLQESSKADSVKSVDIEITGGSPVPDDDRNEHAVSDTEDQREASVSIKIKESHTSASGPHKANGVINDGFQPDTTTRF